MKQSNEWMVRRVWLHAMVVSVCMILCMIAIGIGIARLVLPGQSWQADMMNFIEADSSPQGRFQAELSRLRVYADTYRPEENEDIQDCSQILEAQGITVAVSQDSRIIYATPGSDPKQTVAGVEKTVSWKPNGTDTISMPREYKGLYPLRMQRTWICLFITWLGLSGLLVWVILSKRFMRHMLPYIQLYCNVQTNGKSCGSQHALRNDQHT